MYFKMCFMYRFLLGITDFPHNRHFYLKVKKNFQKKSCLFRVFFFFLIKSLNNTRSIAKLPLFTVQHRFYIYIQVVYFTHLHFYMNLWGQISCQIISKSGRFCCSILLLHPAALWESITSVSGRCFKRIGKARRFTVLIQESADDADVVPPPNC